MENQLILKVIMQLIKKTNKIPLEEMVITYQPQFIVEKFINSNSNCLQTSLKIVGTEFQYYTEFGLKM